MHCCLPRRSCLRNLCNFRNGEEKGNFSIICKIIKLTATTMGDRGERLLGYVGLTPEALRQCHVPATLSLPQRIFGSRTIRPQNLIRSGFCTDFRRSCGKVVVSRIRSTHGNTFDRMGTPTPVSLRADKVKRPPILVYFICIALKN